ncbi:MAG: group II intron reverse transcriptase/maturase [Bacteroidetes bacterium]|nr:group II intron reverse transcriptase/maturase [Bacteroidota bacterium]
MTDYFETKSQPVSKIRVWEAHKELKGNGKSAGVDGISLREFEEDLSKNLYKVWNRMTSGSYYPPPVKEVEIPKKDGSLRKLGIPTVGDRVAQMVVKKYLEPQIEPYFHENSYGYRPHKSAHDALSKTKERCWEYAWVLDLDIKGFFDNLDHDLLLLAVRKHCNEKWVLMYIERWLKAPIQKPDGSLVQRQKGTPQGGVISPLLANLFLHYAFDKWMGQQYPRVQFERYADDIIVHCRTESESIKLLEQIKERLEACKLQLHLEKTKVVYCKQSNRQGDYENVSFTFLGYTFKPRKVKTQTGKIMLGFSPAISKASRKKIRAAIKELNIRNRTSERIEEIANLLNAKVRGWLNYFGKFRPSSLYSVMYGLNQRLIKWVQNRHKRYRNKLHKAINWLKRVYRQFPNLFVHWSYGFQP